MSVIIPLRESSESGTQNLPGIAGLLAGMRFALSHREQAHEQSVALCTRMREVAIGCGLSVRFELSEAAQVMQVYRRVNPGALIGFYRVDHYGTRQIQLTPLHM